MVYHEKVLHNYVIPYPRKYSDQHNHSARCLNSGYLISDYWTKLSKNIAIRDIQINYLTKPKAEKNN